MQSEVHCRDQIGQEAKAMYEGSMIKGKCNYKTQLKKVYGNTI